LISITQNKPLSRRELLCGIGSVFALPALESFAAKPPATPPARTVFLYFPNGVNPLTWQIEQAGARYDFSPALRPLSHLRAHLTPISGLHHPGALGKHHHCDQVWLTAAAPNGDGSPFQNDISADQVIAEQIGERTRLPSLSLAIQGHSLSWSRTGQRVPALRDPITIFRQLFSTPATGSVMDHAWPVAKPMLRQVSRTDQTVLQEHFTAVQELEQRCQAATGCILQRRRLFSDLMLMALRTDSTRVITCMIGSESHCDGLSVNRHTLSHHHDEPEGLRQLTSADVTLVEHFRHFLELLLHEKIGNDSLLDYTQVLWGSGMSDGHRHGTANLPLILAGGCKLGHQHGAHIDYNLPHIHSYRLSDPHSLYALCARPADPLAHLGMLLQTMVHRAGAAPEPTHSSIT
jgi:hypothetical protein